MRPSPAIRFELVAAACLLLAGCSDTRKLDEAIVYSGPQLTLKLVHYHRNLPLHYVGDEYRVMCQSNATRNLVGDRRQRDLGCLRPNQSIGPEPAPA